MTLPMTILPGYDAVLTQGAALYDDHALGLLRLYGRDRAAIIHRLSTNDVTGLKPGQGIRTVLTNHNGRIIDVLTVHAADDHLLVETSPGNRAAIIALLQQNIFFRDDMQIVPADDLHALTLYGMGATALLERLGAANPGAFLPHALHSTIIAEHAITLSSSLALGGAGYRLFVPNEVCDSIQAAILSAGAVVLSPEAFDVLRIEMGYGVFGREHSLEYIPLETGLSDAISFTKGCYVGQEIIARMESRNRLAKTLRGLSLSALPSGPTALVSAENGDAGILTSYASSPRYGLIGLGYIRTAYSEPGTSLSLEGSSTTATIHLLPFAE